MIRPEGAWVGHVGDSRCYRIRKGKIQQLSFDHSLVWELARRQNKAPEELVGVPTNVIVRSLGPEPIVQVDVEGPHPIQAGDYYMLCSDGLSGQVTDREIGAVISSLPPIEACRFLINLANLQGGPDNITLIVVHVAGEHTANSSPVEDETVATVLPGRSLVTRLAPLVKRFWPLILLFLGISLAMVAIYLKAFERPGDLPTFVLAALTLFSGVAGLMFQSARESNEPPPPEEQEPLAPRVYRETACGIELPVVERLVHAVETLEERIKEKNWEMNRDTCHDHREKGRRLQRQGDLRGAFREDCRAMLMLMDAVSKQRNKEESFKPLWDKARNGKG